MRLSNQLLCASLPARLLGCHVKHPSLRLIANHWLSAFEATRRNTLTCRLARRVGMHRYQQWNKQTMTTSVYLLTCLYFPPHD